MTDQTPPPAAQPVGAPLSEADDKQWASLAHLGNILGVIPPLVIWLVFKDRGPKVNVEGKEALNWGITATGSVIVLWIVSAILGFIPFVGVILGLIIGLVILAIAIVNLVFAILGFVAVNNGGSYRYPFAFRFVK